jgi:hypothetical protein
VVVVVVVVLLLMLMLMMMIMMMTTTTRDRRIVGPPGASHRGDRHARPHLWPQLERGAECELVMLRDAPGPVPWRAAPEVGLGLFEQGGRRRAG